MSYKSDKAVRLWYKRKTASIPSMINKADALEKQARQACDLRNYYRNEARKKMKDQEYAKELELNFPNSTFEELLSRKLAKKEIQTLEEAYIDILRTATKTNKEVDAQFAKPKLINTILKLDEKGNINIQKDR